MTSNNFNNSPSPIPTTTETKNMNNNSSSDCLVIVGKSYQQMKGDDEDTIATTENELSIDEAMELLDMGQFQYYILLAAGLCFAADAMEVLLLSFLAIILKVEWDLSAPQTDSIIAVVFLGAMIGTLILGPLGDTIGRKPVFTITAFIIAIFGIGTSFVTNYEWLLVARFFVGFGVGGLTVPFDTLAEFIPTSHRGQNLLYIEFFWTAGTLLVPLLAWWSIGTGSNDNEVEGGGSWRIFVALCAIPCVISTGLGLLVVPESPRWLLTRGRDAEALMILRNAASTNGKDPYKIFPPGTRLTYIHHDVEKNQIWDLLSPQWIQITLRLWILWFIFGFLYYGVILLVSLLFSIHEEGQNDDNGNEEGRKLYDFDYSAIFISASSEVVGVAIVLLTVERWGRISSQVIGYFLGGFCCLILGMLAAASQDEADLSSSQSQRNLLLFFAFIARMCMMGATCTTWVSTPEILSTEIRSTGHSAANAMARIGGFFCPYIIHEENSMPMIGIILFVLGIIASIVASQLPETMGKALGETTTAPSKPPPGGPNNHQLPSVTMTTTTPTMSSNPGDRVTTYHALDN